MAIGVDSLVLNTVLASGQLLEYTHTIIRQFSSLLDETSGCSLLTTIES